MHILHAWQSQYPFILHSSLLIHALSMISGVIAALILTCNLKTFVSATDELELTTQGLLIDVETKLMSVIDNCKESVAVLSLSNLTFSRGNQSTSLYFGDDFLGAPILDFVHDDDRHIFRECISQLLQDMSDDGEAFLEPCRRAFSQYQDDEELGLANSDQKIYINEESPLLSSFTSPPPPPPKEHRSISIEYRVSNQHHDLMWVESTLLLLKEYESTSIMMLTRDITAKKSEIDIIRHENASKLQYITCCAHDLKTPLQSFSSALDLLLASGLSSDQRDILNQAEISLSLMKLTIAQTMDTSKVLMVCYVVCGID